MIPRLVSSMYLVVDQLTISINRNCFKVILTQTPGKEDGIIKAMQILYIYIFFYNIYLLSFSSEHILSMNSIFSNKIYSTDFNSSARFLSTWQSNTPGLTSMAIVFKKNRELKCSSFMD